MEADRTTPTSITRDQVAAEAGVSSATVSRVYNAPHLVTEDRRLRVLEAARRLGYLPNKAASALRRKGSGVITLVDIRKPPRSYYWNSIPAFEWFYADSIRGVKEALQDTMFHLNLETISIDVNESLDRIAASSDAIICFDVDLLPEAEAIKGLGIPFMLAHHTAGFDGYPRCSTDNHFGGSLQAHQLRDAGVLRPIYLTGNIPDVYPHTERLEGFLAAWDGFGLPEPCIISIPGDTGKRGGSSAVPEIVRAVKQSGCDGIAVVNDLTLIGAKYTYDQVTGIGYQDSLVWVGYDAVPFREFLPFSFHSVDIRPRQVYRLAAEQLLSQLGVKTGRCTNGSEVSLTIAPVKAPAITPQQTCAE